jgi:hypothetical protein
VVALTMLLVRPGSTRICVLLIPVLSPALQLRKQNRFFSRLAGKILGPVRTQLLNGAAGGSHARVLEP